MTVLSHITLVIGLGVYLELLARLRAAEPARPWWFGYARDGANLAAALMLTGSYRLIGFRSPEALLAGVLTTLGAYMMDWAIARALRLTHPRLWFAIPLAAWVTFVAFWSGLARRLFEQLIVLAAPG